MHTDKRPEHVNILIVEDNSSLRNSLKGFVKLLGLTCHAVSNAEEALQAIKDNEYNIVITDYMLPGINGLRLLDTLTTSTPGAKVILLTGHSNPEIRIRARQAGAWACLTKPFEPDELEQMLQGVFQANACSQYHEDRKNNAFSSSPCNPFCPGN